MGTHLWLSAMGKYKPPLKMINATEALGAVSFSNILDVPIPRETVEQP